MSIGYKNKTLAYGALLLALHVFIMVQLVSANIVSAYVGSAVFCPNNYVPDYDTEYELWLAEAECTYIRGLLANRYAIGCDYAFNDDCTVNVYCTVLSNLNNSGIIDEIVIFSKGHRGVPYYNWTPTSYNHYSLIDHDGYNLIDYAHIHPRTSAKNTFTFLWHCETALKYPSGIYAYGWYGMPYCWTHNNGLNAYDDTGNQVFLGSTNQSPGSPQFETEIIPDTYNYGNVAGSFWYFMNAGDTVGEALNDVCDMIYDEDFDQTDLHGWLLVLGNMNLGLPED